MNCRRCIIAYYNTEIVSNDDDFHKMLFELVLQAYVKTFNSSIKLDETKQNLLLEKINCSKSESCQYSFPKPPDVPKMIEEIIEKTHDDPDDTREKKCIQVFQHLIIWKEKINKPALFEWAYYLLFTGVESALNVTEVEVKKNLHCASSLMQAMEKTITVKPDDINPFLITFLRERDVQVEVLEDEIEYADQDQIDKLDHGLKVQMLLAELVLKTYMDIFELKPNNKTISVHNGVSSPVMIEIPTMENIPLL